MHPSGAVIVNVPNVFPDVALIVTELFSAMLTASLAFPSIVAPPVIVPAVLLVHKTLIVPTPSSSVMDRVSLDPLPVKVWVKISLPKMSIGMIS